jgi:hypothetical protein
MELLLEILFDVYGELMYRIIPESKMSKKYIIISKIIAVLVFAGVISLALWGAYLVSERDNLIGILPISIAIIISLAQIIAGIVLYKKHH